MVEGLQILEESCHLDRLEYSVSFVSPPADEASFVLFEGVLDKESLPPDLAPQRIGKIVLVIRSSAKMIFIANFYPFGHKPKEDFPYLLGKGIADRIQLLLLKLLLKRFGEKYKVISNFVSAHRKSQLFRLGLEQGQAYPLKSAINLVESAIGV